MCNTDFRKIQKLANENNLEKCYEMASMIVENNRGITNEEAIFCMSYFYYFYDKDKLHWLNRKNIDYHLKDNLQRLIKDLDRKEDRKEEKYILENIKLVRQVGKGCVPASVKMLMMFYNIYIEYKEIVVGLECDISNEGTSIYQLLIYLKKNMFEIYPFQANMKIITAILKYNFPIISITQTENNTNHARIIYGIDIKKNVLFICDPVRGRIVQPIPLYEGTNSIKDLCILAVPQNKIIDKTIIREMEKDIEYFNLLGVLYDEVDMSEKSEEMYKKALLISNKNAEVLNNYAILLFKNKRYYEALQCIDKAINIEPRMNEYKETKEMIKEAKEKI